MPVTTKRSHTRLAVISLAIITQFLVGAGPKLSEVEGLFYLDGKPVTITIKDGKIDRIVRKDKLDHPAHAGVYVAPGFIDNQVNGYANVAFAGEGLTVEGVRQATCGLWEAGVTTYLPTLTTNTHQLLKTNFAVLVKALKDPELARSIPGYHLEGPYISPIDGYRGSHVQEWVRSPDWNEFMELYQASGKKILQVTLAPEVEGALDFIHRLRAEGIGVGLGHHNGSARQIKAAIDAGASISTHLGNGCANLIHRHDNPLWPQLADDRIIASIIVDGFHLRREEVRTFYKAKGSERTIITSDVTSLAGMPPGRYMRRGREVEVTADGRLVIPGKGLLAGSASPISKGIGNFMKFTNASLGETIRLLTRNPARLYGLTDRGEITTGKRADLVLFTLEDGVVNVRQTIIAGEVVYSK